MGPLRIYMHSSGDCVLHRGGFSWIAAVALPVWALTRRLYRTAAMTFLLVLIVNMVMPRLFALVPGAALRGFLAVAYLFAYWLVPGLTANRWHRRVLERRGYFVMATDLRDEDRVKA